MTTKDKRRRRDSHVKTKRQNNAAPTQAVTIINQPLYITAPQTSVPKELIPLIVNRAVSSLRIALLRNGLAL